MPEKLEVDLLEGPAWKVHHRLGDSDYNKDLPKIGFRDLQPNKGTTPSQKSQLVLPLTLTLIFEAVKFPTACTIVQREDSF